MQEKQQPGKYFVFARKCAVLICTDGWQPLLARSCDTHAPSMTSPTIVQAELRNAGTKSGHLIASSVADD
jgi:hypothetical protein